MKRKRKKNHLYQRRMKRRKRKRRRHPQMKKKTRHLLLSRHRQIHHSKSWQALLTSMICSHLQHHHKIVEWECSNSKSLTIIWASDLEMMETTILEKQEKTGQLLVCSMLRRPVNLSISLSQRCLMQYSKINQVRKERLALKFVATFSLKTR